MKVPSILDPILNLFGQASGGYITYKQTKLEGKIRVEEARTEAEVYRQKRTADAEVEYDVEAQRQMQYSWKDEYFLFIMSIPFLGSFIPYVQDYMLRGWEYLAKAPRWYQFCFIGMLVSTYGLRWYVKAFGGAYTKVFKNINTE